MIVLVISITDKAKNKLQKILSAEETDKLLRLYIAGYGWGGPSFGMALDEPKEDDIKIESEGFKFIVEDGLCDIYEKFFVDYNDNWLRKGFVISPERGNSSSC